MSHQGEWRRSLGVTGCRARLHNARTLEEVLVRDPGPRVYIKPKGKVWRGLSSGVCRANPSVPRLPAGVGEGMET